MPTGVLIDPSNRPRGQSASSRDHDTGTHGGTDLSLAVSASHHAEASREGPDGIPHDYASDADIVFTADASAAFAVAASLARSDSGE